MPRHFKKEPDDQNFSLKFGGGINTAKSAFDIAPNECVDGLNFRLQLDSESFVPRHPSLQVDIANAVDTESVSEEINGFAQHVTRLDNDAGMGRVRTLLQSGTGFMEFDVLPQTNGAPQVSLSSYVFADGFTINANSRLRGYADWHAWDIGKELLITDLELLTPVFLWNPVSSTATVLTAGGSDFFAKYCLVDNDRAWFSYIKSGASGVVTPHMVVASKVEDVLSLSVANKPSSAIGADDPFFFLTPDFSSVGQPIAALGLKVFPTSGSSMFILSGSSSNDFFLSPLFGGSAGATSDQHAVLAENDVLYASEEGIQTLAGTEAFGDVENDDVSRKVKNYFSSARGEFRPSTPLTFSDSSLDPYSVTYNTVDDYRILRTLYLAYLDTISTLFVLLKISNRTSTTPLNKDGFLWSFYKSFHNQKAKDVSLLKSGEDVSGWAKLDFSGVVSRAASDGANFGATDVVPFYVVTDSPSSGTPNVGALTKTMLLLAGTRGVDPPQSKAIVYPWPYYANSSTGGAFDRRGDFTLQKTSGSLSTQVLMNTVSSTSDIRSSRLSKVISPPSGMSFSDFTGVVNYIPRSENEVTLTIAFVLVGKRAKIHKASVSLRGYSSGQGDAPSRTLPISKIFGIPNLPQGAVQVGVEVNSKYDFEVLSIEFNAKG